MAAMGPLGDSYALRCVSDLPPPFRPVFGFRFVRGDAYAHQTPCIFFFFGFYMHCPSATFRLAARSRMDSIQWLEILSSLVGTRLNW